MPNIVVRAMLPEDNEGFQDVRALTYNDGNEIPPERREFKFTRPYVARLDDEVSGCFVLLDLTCTRGEAVLPCAGVAGVAVYPHRRKSGVGSEMMNWLVRHLKETGTPMASLYPFRETFYRRFGYEVAGKRIKITCPTVRLPKTTHGLPIRRLKPTDWAELDTCYREFAHQRSGLTLRTEKLWERVVSENRALTIYAAGDPVEAYVVVSHSTAFWSTDHMSDVAWSTRNGYLALMEIFAGIAINKTALTWFEPSDSPFYSDFLDQGVLAEVQRPVMYRVCDVPGGLRALKTTTSGEFTIRIQDDLVPENEGPWRVSYSPEGVEVAKSPWEADLEMDVRAFAQAFLGEPSLADLARNGRVVVRDAAALSSAQQLLTPSPVICADFF